MRFLSPLKAMPQLPALRPLQAAIADRDNNPARITWWGDSVSEGTGLTDAKLSLIYRFQEMLRGAFPTKGARGGRGYVPVYYVAPTLPAASTQDLTANTGGTSAVYADNAIGLGGRSYTLVNGAALVWTEAFTDFEVHYGKDGAGAGFTVFVDGVQQGSAIPSVLGSFQGGFVQAFTGFAPGTHTIRIASNASGTGSTTMIAGIHFYYGDYGKGIHIEDAARNGTSAYAGAGSGFATEHYRIIATQKPAAVVLQLITNDAIYYSSPTAYKADIATNLATINSMMGGSPYTLIGLTVSEPNSAFQGGALWPEYVKGMKEAVEAYSNGVFVNMADFMGPKVAGDPLGLWTDAVHPSAKGHSLVADRLLWALNLNGGGTTLPLSITYETIPFFKNGTLAVAAAKFGTYNDTGAVWTVAAARAEVDTAPTGAAVVLAVKVDGTTKFTLSIPSGSKTSGKVVPATFAVPDGSRVSVDITQVGSAIAGADLGITLTVASVV